jgi:hypothetical protein
MNSNLPLNWANKINSPLSADFIAKHGAEYCMTAEEINQLRDAVNEMAVVQQSVFMGVVIPTDTPTGTGARFWFSVIAGTYTNFGGVVVTANSFALISVTAAGAFSVSQTAFDITSKVNVSDIINVLNSSETAKPLSAAQGKVLKDLIDTKTNTVVVDNLNSTNGTNALSAAQGKVLKDLVDTKTNTVVVDNLSSTSSTSALSANQGRLLDLKIAQGLVEWTAKPFLLGEESIFLGKLWRTNAATLSTDIPGTSSKWVEVLNAYVENLDVEIYSKNEIDLTKPYIQSNKGVGNDGVIFSATGFGMIEGIPVLANTSYVISGCQSLRGLRFETSTGTLISFIGTISNGTSFVTPANTARISFQVYSTTTGSLFTLVQLEKGTVASPYSSYSASVKSVLGVEVKGYNSEPTTLSKTTLVGKNKFNKITSPTGNYKTGTGIGDDGLLYLGANAGSAIGVPVLPNTVYVISGAGGLRGLRFERADASLISFIGTISNGTSFVTPANTARISFQIHATASVNLANIVQVEEGFTVTKYENYVKTEYISSINNQPLLSSKEDEGSLDYELLLPKNIYSIVNNINGDYSTGTNTSLWIQKLIREKNNLLINGLNVITLNKYKNTNAVDVDNVNLSITGSGLLTKRVSIPRVSVRSTILATQFPKVLYIGDSITENRLKNGVIAGAGALWTMPEEIALKNKIDNAGVGYDYLCVGRLMKLDTTINYKNQSVNLVGYAEGKGGWSAMDYLRHPFRMWVFNNQGAWDLLGLTTLMGRNYVNNANDRKLIATTIYGVNTPLITADSYDLLVKESQIANLGSWTNSAPQITAVQNWITGITNDTNTSNEFFDINKTGTNRFSVVKYLNSYKTLETNGTTRLTVGSTAGTKVTNSNNSDVCEPTHIVICLGENDRLHYSDYVQIADDIMELASIIRAEFPNIHVGIALTSIPGDMFPERNPDYVGFFYQNEHNNKYDLYKELSSRFGDVATQKTNKTYLIPTWHTGTPLSNSLTREVVSENEPNKVVQIGNNDYNHPGYYHNRSAGVQIYGWVAYTLS